MTMPPLVQEVLQSWSLPVPVTVAIALTAVVYARGWLHLRRAVDHTSSVGAIVCFEGGMFALWIALGSPLEAFADELLSVHMVQHILLMAIVPPLVLFGAPTQPILHGLPSAFVRAVLGPLLRYAPARRIGRLLITPWFAWFAATTALIAWHVPAAFELAIRSEGWHEVEHACFFATSILFWWPVIEPWPSVTRGPRWRIVPYLFFGMLGNDAVSAFLTFCNRVLYPSAHSGHFPISPLADQALSGAIMWVVGTFVYLVPAVLIAFRLLTPLERAFQRGATAQRA
jgi:putative membrane protein